MVVLDPERTEVRRNGEWLSKLSYADVVRLARTITVARILERDDFAKRMAAQQPISVSELLYPLMQAYDSVAIEADVELGGTDQLYNLLAGREVMAHYGLEPQVVLTTPLLVSWDGEKMSSSVGNNIPLTAPPEEMFGRTMRIPDSQLADWWQLVAERESPVAEPMESKLALARWIVARSHGEEAARAARGALHPRRPARARRPRTSRTCRSRTATRCTCRRSSSTAFGVGSTLRGEAPDRAGRREAERRAGGRARRRRGSASRGALLQVGKRRFGRLTGT